MNRKKLFSLAMLVMMLTALFSVHANALAPAAPSLTNSSCIPLQVRIFDPTIGSTPFPKSPVQVPDVYIDGYTLTFDESCDECTLRIVNDEDEVEFTTVIMSNTVVLPSTLQGEYEIQIIRGKYCFYGDIEL